MLRVFFLGSLGLKHVYDHGNLSLPHHAGLGKEP